MKVYVISNTYFIEDHYGRRYSFTVIDGVYASAEKAKERVEKSIAEKSFAKFTDYIYLDPSKIIGGPVVGFNPDYDPISCSLLCSIAYEGSNGCEYYQDIYIREYEVVE